MAVKVVVVDSAHLPAGVEFPPLEVAKYGWEQYPAISAAEIAERCWRADILVTLASRVDRSMFGQMQRLKLIVAAGSACAMLDQVAARDSGVEILIFPDANCADASEAQDLCNRISRAIDHYVRNWAG